MDIRKTSFVVCLVVSMLCLAAGYGFAGQWIGTVIAITLGLAWLPARKYPVSGLPHICLIASVGLAVIGQLTGTLPLLMIIGSAFALAVWDLILLDAVLGANSSGEQIRRYENKHLQSLALVLGAGLLAACLGGLLNLQIHFVAMMLFVALVIFGFDRVWRTIKRRSSQ
ncbi:MAG TPA: hypothetical protein VK249_08320 [Anaerolineales bacterium]|nr:hypothetical protein [Anaerolineales bacterium]